MKILRLISSIRGNESYSHKLGSAIIAKLKNRQTVTQIKELNLAENEIPHLNQKHFTSFITGTEHMTAELKIARETSDKAIEDLQNADVIVIEVPMYNFTIPSSLKSWFDHIVRAGVTFRYTEIGVEGLVKSKKVYLAIASGGIYSEGPMKEFDFTERYLRNVLRFIGVEDVTVFRVEGFAIPNLKDVALSNALDTVESYSFHAYKGF